MNQIRARRVLAIVLTVLVAAGATLLSTGCDPVSRDWAWKAGKTHGAIIETTAGRASLGIYRAPSNGLYGLYRWGGIKKAQDAIWKVGRPPVFTKTFTYRGRSITTSFGTKALAGATRSLIYDHPSDLGGAIVDAHTHRSCVALTLISYGQPTRNWTQKQVGCRDGAI